MTERESPSADDETRVAPITPIGAAGIAVIRMVGPDALRIAERVLVSSGRRIEPGRILCGRIVDDGQVIDDVVATARPAHADGGERCGDLVEINPHGGVRVVQRVLMLLVRHGARLADPDRIGLVGWPAGSAIEREAWSSLTHAQTHRAATWLTRQQTILPALLCRCVERLARRDDRDVPGVSDELAAVLGRYHAARRLVEGAFIAIVGPPNAGKSTLANRLFGRSRSLVAEQPGTTRDWVAEPAAVEGVPIVLVDTAGVRAAEDSLERSAIERGLSRSASADALLFVLDRSEAMTASSRYAIASIRGTAPANGSILVLNKCDLPDRLGAVPDLDADWSARVEVSATTGAGADLLGRAMVRALGLADWTDDMPAVWTARQRDGLAAAAARLPGDPGGAASALTAVVEN